MHFAVIVVTLASLVVGLPQSLGPRADDPRFTNWTPPGPGDVRSPCPGLNSLANHGFINHSGRNLTVQQLQDGIKAGLNVGADFSQAIGKLGLLASPDPLKGMVDLDMLDRHSFPIEHDVSLSRQDAFFGNDYSFHQPSWNMVLEAYSGKTFTDIPTASKAKYTRFLYNKANDPTLTYGPRELIFSYGETALYLQTMGDTTSGRSRLDFIRTLFEKERLPYDLGWRPSKNEVNLMTLGAQVVQLYLSSPGPLLEGLVVTANTYKDVLVAAAAGKQIAGNVVDNA